MVKAFLSVCILSVLLVACTGKSYVSYTSEGNRIDSTYNDTTLEGLIEPYRTEMEGQMNKVIGYSDSALTKYAPESPLGNFVADIVYAAVMNSPIDTFTFPRNRTMALLNFGGLRSPINRGTITIGNVYELMPFDNTIFVLELEPKQISEMLNYIDLVKGQPVSHASIDLIGDQQRIQINNTEYQFEESVFVITSNYLASGGDLMNFLKIRKRGWDTGILIRDAIIDHIEKANLITYPKIQGRIKVSGI